MFDKTSAVAALEARRAQLAGIVASLRQKQFAAPEIGAEQTQIARDYDVLKSGYENLLQAREQVRLKGEIASKTKEVEFKTVDPPTLPDAPSAPNRPLLLTLVLVAGLVLGLGVTFIASQLRPSYVTEERLAGDTGLPVLGSIGEVVDRVTQRRQKRLTYGFAAGTVAAVGVYAVIMAVNMVRGGGA